MIVVKLMGGLGNQMFQYAIGRALAEQHKSKLYLDHSFLEDRTPKTDYFTFRNYELIAFGIDNRLSEFTGNMFGLRQSRFKKQLSKIWKFKTITDNILIKSDTSLLNNNLYLDDYFQSEKYFAQYKNLIREVFTFKESSIEKNKILIEKIKATKNSVALHVRRGDYLIISDGKFHQVCDSDYYHLALKIISERIPNPTIFIFSADDPEWPQKKLNIFCTNYIVGNSNTGILGFENMRLMSLCDHNIIANSSFSWWGAWLNENPKKIVIAPKKWFADSQKNEETIDLIPKEWIRI